jgi:extradiol dioxygenase family protein
MKPSEFRQHGEQTDVFLLDPCGNALEFEAFADRAGVR